jgi:mRNA-degrading endonuclease toxin of MazEF toxin-antitoxin module
MGAGEPVLIIQQGEVYLAATESGNRPVIFLSREELNRGRWVVAVPVTSAEFAIRSKLPHCVPFANSEFGLTKDCVAQAEAITYIGVSDLDLDAGAIGTLDELRLRDVIKAVGNMMSSECEPE